MQSCSPLSKFFVINLISTMLVLSCVILGQIHRVHPDISACKKWHPSPVHNLIYGTSAIALRYRFSVIVFSLPIFKYHLTPSSLLNSLLDALVTYIRAECKHKANILPMLMCGIEPDTRCFLE